LAIVELGQKKPAAHWFVPSAVLVPAAERQEPAVHAVHAAEPAPLK
jgi:hypothetical protein